MTHKMALTQKQIIKNARKIERELQIELGMNFSRHRVHTSKKTYSRKEFKKNLENY
jgi:hypothetical protein